jgi:WD40 repeat protein
VGSIGGFYRVDAFEWSPDGTQFAAAIFPEASSKQIIQIWNYQERAVIYETANFEGETLAISWHPLDTTLALGMNDGVIQLWNFATQEYDNLLLPAEAENGTIKVNDIAWHPSGSILASADRAGRILVWHPDPSS